MKTNAKTIVTVITLAVLLMTCAAGCGNNRTPESMREAAAGYLLEKVAEPGVGSIGGDWTVMGLARGNAEVPQGYYETYYDNVRVTVKEKDGVLDERRYTEYARVAIALNAIGKDPTAVEGYNLLKNLDNTKAVEAQGINGPIWALIAAGVCEYELKNEQRYLQAILDAELAEGGFSLMEEEEASPDLSGMALQALSFYPGNEEAAQTVDRTVETLAGMQREDGDFDNSSETVSQVILGLTAVGIDPLQDSRFIKDEKTLFDVLAAYSGSDGGFCHEKDGKTDLMATEQAMCALDALLLQEDGSAFYECSK